MLPGMNGLEVVEKIKDNEKTGKIPVLILPAPGQEESVSDALTKGED